MITVENVSWIGWGLASAFAWSLVTFFEKLGATHLDQTVAATVRAMVISIFLFGALMASSKVEALTAIDGRAWIYILLSGLCGAFSWFAYFLALKYGPVSKVALFDPLSLVFVVFIAKFVGEAVTIKSIIGVILLVIGSLVVAL